MRAVLTLVVGLLPSGRLKNSVLRRLGHDISSSAVLMPVLLLRGARLKLGEQSRIGALTVIRGAHVALAACAEIGQLNWISAAPFLVASSNQPHAGQLRLGNHASVTNRHYFDVSGGVVVGEFATVAGIRSTFMTHGIEVQENLLRTDGIEVGAYSMVGGNVSVVLGATIPARSVVGMGAVVVRGLATPGGLYVGSPAQWKRPVDLGRYGARSVGAVPASAGLESSPEPLD